MQTAPEAPRPSAPTFGSRGTALKVLVAAGVCAYFGYVFYWFAKTVPWIIRITLSPEGFLPAAGINPNNPVGVPASYLMEYVGFLGLAVRLAAACFALFAAVLVLKGEAWSPRMKSAASKAIMLEGAYFFSFIPAFYYLAAVSTLPVTSRACLSGQLAVQLALIAPTLLMLGWKLNKSTQTQADLTKWAAVAAVCYVVALWVSYWFKWTEMSALEGLRFLIVMPRAVAFFNTAIVFSLSALFAVLAARKLLRGRDAAGALRLWGISAILLSTHLIIFIAFCLYVNAAFLAVYAEMWIIPLMALGAYFLLASRRRKGN